MSCRACSGNTPGVTDAYLSARPEAAGRPGRSSSGSASGSERQRRSVRCPAPHHAGSPPSRSAITFDADRRCVAYASFAFAVRCVPDRCVCDLLRAVDQATPLAPPTTNCPACASSPSRRRPFGATVPARVAGVSGSSPLNFRSHQFRCSASSSARASTSCQHHRALRARHSADSRRRAASTMPEGLRRTGLLRSIAASLPVDPPKRNRGCRASHRHS